MNEQIGMSEREKKICDSKIKVRWKAYAFSQPGKINVQNQVNFFSHPCLAGINFHASSDNHGIILIMADDSIIRVLSAGQDLPNNMLYNNEGEVDCTKYSWKYINNDAAPDVLNVVVKLFV